MRTMTYSRYVMVKAMKPATYLVREGGKQIVYVSDYDIHEDTTSVAKFELVDDASEARQGIQPGDILGIENTQGGAKVVDLLEALGEKPMRDFEGSDGGRLPQPHMQYDSSVWEPAQGYVNTLRRKSDGVHWNPLNGPEPQPGKNFYVRPPIVTDGAKLNEEHARENAKGPLDSICHAPKLPDTKGFHEGTRWGDGNGRVYVLWAGQWLLDAADYVKRSGDGSV